MDRDIPLTGPVTAEERFDELMERYGKLLRSAIARLCPHGMSAEHDDIRQEAYIRLWRVVASGRELPASASYIYRVATTTTIDAIRRVKARREEAIEPLMSDGTLDASTRAVVMETPHHTAERQQIIERTMKVVATLPADRRRAITLHLQGLTTQEIGDLLGWSEAKARNLVYRTLKDLRAQLAREGLTL